jgi:hypothetical protein
MKVKAKSSMLHARFIKKSQKMQTSILLRNPKTLTF